MVFKSGRTAPQTEGIENNAAVMIWEDDALTQNVVIISSVGLVVAKNGLVVLPSLRLSFYV